MNAQIIPFPLRASRLFAADEAMVKELRDAQAGMAWWESLAPAERLRWMNCAGSASIREAWEAFKDGMEAG